MWSGPLIKMVTSPVGAAEKSQVTFGPPDEHPQGSARGAGGAWLLRDQEGYFALKGRCSHLGCQVQWDEDSGFFQCPCHGSSYDYYGRVLTGPATLPLTPVAVALNQEGRLVVELKQQVTASWRLTIK